jgi:urease accessory protein
MLVITEARVAADAAALAGKTRDTLCLGWEERRWTRRRAVTTGGREVALALPTGSVLEPGAVLAVETDWYLVVEARPEPLLAVFPASHDEALRIAFDVGNRHFTLGVEDDVLLVPDDLAMAHLLVRLGVRWERREAVYAPLGGGSGGHE